MRNREKGLTSKKGRGRRERREEASLVIRFCATMLAVTVQLPWLKVRRNFLMYVGESVGRWLASVLRPAGPGRGLPTTPGPASCPLS